MADSQLDILIRMQDEASAKIAALEGQLKKLNSTTGEAETKTSRFGTAMTAGATIGGTIFKTGLIAGTLAVGGLVVAMKGAVGAFEESQNVMAQTNAVLKSTHGVAGVTAQKVAELGFHLQQTTRYTDETVASAENMLLTFTSIGKDVFPDATRTVLDMSTALGQDTKNSAIQLGKALNDPIHGVTALRRVGVQFTDAQRDQIDALVKSGHQMEAQKLILKELQTEFGGSAEAAGKTFAGQLDILHNRLGEVQETIGASITKALIPFITQINAWAQSDAGIEFIDNLTYGIHILAQDVIPAFIRATVRAVEVTIDILKWLNQHREVVFAVAGVISAFLVVAFYAWAAAAGTAAIATIAATWPIIAIGAAVGLVALQVVKHWDTIKQTFASGINKVIDYVNIVGRALGKLPGGKYTDIGHVSFMMGGTMPADGLAYLHEGERVVTAQNNRFDQGVTINIYGNLSTANGANDVTDLAEQLSRKINMAGAGI